MNDHQNLFEMVKEHICRCSSDLEITPSVEALLKMPMKELHISIPLRMDNGSIQAFQGFRVQYNDALGPTKGGLRFHPDETIDTIRGLAALMTWKCAIHNLPLGGGKGGIICNPKEMSAAELERLCRAYIQGIYQFIGPDSDIPAPDVYTNPQMMAWMMDEYSRISGKTTFGVITGKPVSLGGSEGRDDATARGGWYVIREAAQDYGIHLENSTVAIQGFGNVGSNAAILAGPLCGCKVVAISDSRGGVYNPAGIDIGKVILHKKKAGIVQDFEGSSNISNEELLELGVDILIPAALENAITRKNADKIKAKFVAEFANGPITKEAEEILYAKKIPVIPDILCNGGGVIVSYFEMVQNFNMDHWDEADIHRRLEKKMKGCYRGIQTFAHEHKVPLRQAAYTTALTRVVKAMKLRGWI